MVQSLLNIFATANNEPKEKDVAEKTASMFTVATHCFAQGCCHVWLRSFSHSLLQSSALDG